MIARNRIQTESVVQEVNINKMRAMVEASVEEAWFYADSIEKYKVTPFTESTYVEIFELYHVLLTRCVQYRILLKDFKVKLSSQRFWPLIKTQIYEKRRLLVSRSFLILV